MSAVCWIWADPECCCRTVYTSVWRPFALIAFDRRAYRWQDGTTERLPLASWIDLQTHQLCYGREYTRGMLSRQREKVFPMLLPYNRSIVYYWIMLNYTQTPARSIVVYVRAIYFSAVTFPPTFLPLVNMENISATEFNLNWIRPNWIK